MKITLSKAQWIYIGKKCGWIKKDANILKNAGEKVRVKIYIDKKAGTRDVTVLKNIGGLCHTITETLNPGPGKNSPNREAQEMEQEQGVSQQEVSQPGLGLTYLNSKNKIKISTSKEKFEKKSDDQSIEVPKTNELKKSKELPQLTLEMAQDPNCEPILLANYLKSGKNDLIAQYAARNPNCPPEILIEIMQELKDDLLSRNAYLNPNCPKEYKKLWLKNKMHTNTL